MNWSVTPTYAGANHEPAVTIRGSARVSARPGETVRLEGTASDPDGNAVTVRWWRWKDVDTYPGEVSLSDPTALATRPSGTDGRDAGPDDPAGPRGHRQRSARAHPLSAGRCLRDALMKAIRVERVCAGGMHCGVGRVRRRPASANRRLATTGSDHGNTRYSSLDQINRDNVASLEVAWTYRTGDAPAGGHSQIQATPIVVDGVLYTTTPALAVFALRADSGTLIWRFDPFANRDASRT